MKKYFLKLYQYNAWANKRVLDCLTRQNVSDEKIMSLRGSCGLPLPLRFSGSGTFLQSS